MKKLIALILIAACIFAVVGCTSETPETDDGTTTTAKTTTTPRGQIPDDEDPEKEDPKPDVDLGTVTFTLDAPFTDTFDLTAEGTKYWEFYGEVEQGVAPNMQYKAIESEDQDIIETFFNSQQTHWDNKGTITWSDGSTENGGTAAATTLHGMNTTQAVYVDVTIEGCTEIKCFVGVWNAVNVMKIYDDNDKLLAEENIAEAAGDASITIVTIDLSQYKGTVLKLEFATSNASNNGNVSLSAITVK